MWLTVFFGIFLLIALVLLIMIATAFFGFAMTHVPFVPTAASDVRNLVTRGLVKSTDRVFDLGSGNGKVLFMLERFAGSSGLGFEVLVWTHWYARLKKIVVRSRVKFVLGNFFNHDLSDATVVYCYLYPPLMSRVGEKILTDCRPGTRVIARDFAIPNLKQVERFSTSGKHEIFVYEI